MPLTLTSTDLIVASIDSAAVTSTVIATLTITPYPLTTVWEPPLYCTQSYLSNCQTDAVSGTLPCFVSLYPQGVCDSNGQSCYPAIPGALDNTYLYSPGLACPTGWTTASAGVLSPSGGQDDETTAHCCPMGLAVTTYGTYSTWCQGTITAGKKTMIVNGLSECPSSTTAFNFGPDQAVDLTWLNVDSTRISVSGAAAFTVSAEQVVLLYKSSDLATAIASATTGLSAGTPTGDIAAPSTQSAAEGLSQAATAGIGIAAAAVGIAAVLGAFYLFLRYRKEKGISSERYQGRAKQRPGGGGIISENLAAQPYGHIAGALVTPQGQYELKAGGLESSRSSPVRSSVSPMRTSGAVELQGSAPTHSHDHPWSGLPPHTVCQHLQADSELPGVHEVSNQGAHYYQLSGLSTTATMDESRQSTPLDMIRHHKGGQGL